MAKKRIALTIDEDIVEHFKRRVASEGGKSLSSLINHLLTQLALKDKLKKKV